MFDLSKYKAAKVLDFSSSRHGIRRICFEISGKIFVAVNNYGGPQFYIDAQEVTADFFQSQYDFYSNSIYQIIS